MSSRAERRRARSRGTAITAVAAITAALLLTLAPAARAADPYVVNVILPLTGNLAFVGTTEQQSLKAVEAWANRTGGIDGRPLQFAISDDSGDVKTGLQLAQNLIAKNVPIIMGPSSPQGCAALAPIVAQNGPVLYCLANAGNPVTGGYEFLTLFPYEPQFAVTFRYFRLRGMKKVAYLLSNDAGGQDAERAILAMAALPENKDIQIVAREHFAPGDISVGAQLSRIKAAGADVLFAWATGGAAGTIFRNMRDAGMDMPNITSTGNLSANFFKQYGALLPANTYFAAVSYYAGDASYNAATKNAIGILTSELANVGAKPDMIEISTWDPAMVVVDALRKLGPNATAAQLRTYLNNLRGWTGVNGPYDFRANPQRGIGENNIVMVRWDNTQNTAIPVSKLGGIPLK
jgi:branched-chain amino acid transport system substrate-binding protein